MARQIATNQSQARPLHLQWDCDFGDGLQVSPERRQRVLDNLPRYRLHYHCLGRPHKYQGVRAFWLIQGDKALVARRVRLDFPGSYLLLKAHRRHAG